MAKALAISAFVASLSVIFIYGNYLMVYRPNVRVPEHGLIYPFVGKGDWIFISIQDYAVLILSAMALVVSMIAANRLYKAKP